MKSLSTNWLKRTKTLGTIHIQRGNGVGKKRIFAVHPCCKEKGVELLENICVCTK